MKRSIQNPLLALLGVYVFALAGCPNPSSSSGSVTAVSPTVSHFVGSLDGAQSTDGTGASARFSHPFGAAVTSDGSTVYVSDNGGNTIRKVTVATGAVTTIAGSQTNRGTSDGTGTGASFANPAGLALSADDSTLFIADQSPGLIRKLVLATGVVTTIAGSAYAFSEADGTGSAAQFNGPANLVTDGTNLFVTDQWGKTIRKVVIATGVVTTLAGSKGNNGEVDGSGTSAQFNAPYGIAWDGGTNLYVTDMNGDTLRQVTTAGVVTTLAGTPNNGNLTDGSFSTSTNVQFNGPAGITFVNESGTYFLVLVESGTRTIRLVNLTAQTVVSIAGNTPPQWVDGTDHAGQNNVGNVSFNNPLNVVYSATAGKFFVADAYNNAVRTLTASSSLSAYSSGSTTAVATLAGASTIGTTDGTGAAARFNSPQGMYSDGTNLYVADQFNGVIRKIVLATGATSTLVGTSGNVNEVDGTGSAAQFGAPSGIVGDGTNLYVTDLWGNTIRKVVIATGVVTTLAGSSFASGETDGQGSAARFNGPSAITTDGTSLFVTDQWGNTIRKVTKGGTVTTFAGAGNSGGEVDGVGTAARFGEPAGIASDGTNLFVTDHGAPTVRKIVIATAAVSTLAGAVGQFNDVDGTGSGAQFWDPWGIAFDNVSGKLFVTDQSASTVRQIIPGTGAVTTLAGHRYLVGIADGVGTAAYFDLPGGLVVAGNNLYVAEAYSSNNVRKITLR